MKLPARGQADLNWLSILLNRKFTIQIPGIAHFSKQGSRIVHGGLLDGEVRQDHWNNFKG